MVCVCLFVCVPVPICLSVYLSVCSWTFPSILAKDAIGFNISLNPRVLERFHEYIQNQSGLTKPADFGAPTWSDVKPLTNLSAIELGTDPKLVAARRILFYWTVRYTAWDTESCKCLHLLDLCVLLSVLIDGTLLTRKYHLQTTRRSSPRLRKRTTTSPWKLF
eukprot:SAG11_NODE_1737_length_4343_cov_2.762488_1_plen_163_part_00